VTAVFAVVAALGCLLTVAAISFVRRQNAPEPIHRDVGALETEILAAASVSEVLDRVVVGAREVFGAKRAVVFRLDESWRAVGPDATGEIDEALATPMSWFAHNPAVVEASELERARFGAIGPALTALFDRFGIDTALPLVDRRLVVAVIGLQLGPLASTRRDALEEIRGFSGAACANLRLHAEAAHAVNLDREASDLAGLAMALSPEPATAAVEAAAYASHCRVVGTIGSDFAQVCERADALWVVVGDAVGNGLPAALIAAAVKGAVDATLAPGRPLAPDRLIAFANLPLDRPDGRARASCIAARIEGHVLEHCNAGHVSPYLLRGSALSALASPSPLLGQQGPWRRVRTRLESGDCLIFLSNGVVDAIGDGDDQRGHRRLQRLLCDCAGLDANSISARITAAAVERCPQPRDDETAVVVHVR